MWSERSLLALAPGRESLALWPSGPAGAGAGRARVRALAPGSMTALGGGLWNIPGGVELLENLFCTFPINKKPFNLNIHLLGWYGGNAVFTNMIAITYLCYS